MDLHGTLTASRLHMRELRPTHAIVVARPQRAEVGVNTRSRQAGYTAQVRVQLAHTWLSSSSSGIHPLALEAAKAFGSSQARRPPSEMNTLCGMLASASRTHALHSPPFFGMCASHVWEACR